MIPTDRPRVDPTVADGNDGRMGVRRPGTRRNRRLVGGVLAGLLLLLAAGASLAVLTLGRDVLGDDEAPPVSTAEAGFAVAFGPRLRAAHEQATVLVALAEERSRNLLAINAEQRRMEERLAAADGAIGGTPPAAFAEAVGSYRRGAAAVRRAMDEAQAGFLRFDWDRVARATDVLTEGTAELAAADALVARTGDRSPTASSER